MSKSVCTVCGYIAEGAAPDFCPVCKAPKDKFVEKSENTYVTEHVVGIAKEGVPGGDHRRLAHELQRRVQRGWHVPGHEPRC